MNALKGREILKLSGIKQRLLPARSLSKIPGELPRFFCVVGNIQYMLPLRLVDRASFINTLSLFQLDTLLFFLFTFTNFYNYSLHVSDRLVHHQENQITRAASGTIPSFVVISCVAVGAN